MKKDKLINYIYDRTKKYSYKALRQSRISELCEIIEFELHQDIYQVYAELNIK